MDYEQASGLRPVDGTREGWLLVNGLVAKSLHLLTTFQLLPKRRWVAGNCVGGEISDPTNGVHYAMGDQVIHIPDECGHFM